MVDGNAAAGAASRLRSVIAFAFAFLTLNSVVAVYRARHDVWSVLFISTAFLVLVLLFLCVHLLERTPHYGGDSGSRRRWLRVAVWTLSTVLTSLFTYRVAAILPFPAKVLVWSLAAATVAGGYYGFFVYDDVPASRTLQSNRYLKGLL